MEQSIATSIINLSRFVSKVKAMRSAQADYISTKQHNDLARAKAVEKEVDEMIQHASESASYLNKLIND